MSGKYQNKIYVCMTTEIKSVCFRCVVWFFVFVCLVFFFGGGCVGVVIFWLCGVCVFLFFFFKALGCNSMLAYRQHRWCHLLNRVVLSLPYSLSVFLLHFFIWHCCSYGLMERWLKEVIWLGNKKSIFFLACWLGFPYGQTNALHRAREAVESAQQGMASDLLAAVCNYVSLKWAWSKVSWNCSLISQITFRNCGVFNLL